MAIPGSQLSPNIKASAFTTSTSSALALAANPTRAGILFQNIDATNAIGICPTSAGSANLTGTNGTIKLAAGASLFIDNVKTIDAFNAIAAAGTPILSIWEF